MIQVNGNKHAHCQSCGARPDEMIVSVFDDGGEDENFTLCLDCGVKLVKAAAGYIALTSPAHKRELTNFFASKVPAERRKARR